MTTSAQQFKTKRGTFYHLPLPPFFDDSAARTLRGEIFPPDYVGWYNAAQDWAKTYALASPATDRVKIGTIGIDQQVTFLYPPPWGQLTVANALDGAVNWAAMVLHNLGNIREMGYTLDWHQMWQIFHGQAYLRTKDGKNAPPANVPISRDELAKCYRVNPQAAWALEQSPNAEGLQNRQLLDYASKLKTGEPDLLSDQQKAALAQYPWLRDQYDLTPWVFHSISGGMSASLAPIIEQAAWFWAAARGAEYRRFVKGTKPYTEAYSPCGDEVKTGPNKIQIGSVNQEIFDYVLKLDALVAGGEAASHCFRAFLYSLLLEILVQEPSFAKKVFILKRCTHPVIVPGIVDFTAQADEALERARELGVNVIEDETQPLVHWKGMAEALGL